MKIHTLPLGEMQANCYIIETNTDSAVIIDCGGEAERLLDFLKKNKLTAAKILLTHGHFDHIEAVGEILNKTHAEVFIHKYDAVMLSDAQLNLSYMLNRNIPPIERFTEISDGFEIIQDELTFKAMHTPGHTRGGVCYLCDSVIFSGDTLFQGNIGRTDFPGGSFNELKQSVDRLAALEGNYTVFPGHGDKTTLVEEKRTNIYFRNNYNDFDF